MDREDYGKVHDFQPYIPSCYPLKVHKILGQDNRLYKVVGDKKYVWHEDGYWMDCDY